MNLNEKIKLGDRAEISRSFTDKDVDAFATLSLDKNPIHLDHEYAMTTTFGKRIVHGMLVSSLFSALLANKLPGNGAIYLGQNLSFIAPCFLNEQVTASVEVIGVREDKPIYTLKTLCVNSKNELLIKGEAVVLFS